MHMINYYTLCPRPSEEVLARHPSCNIIELPANIIIASTSTKDFDHLNFIGLNIS